MLYRIGHLAFEWNPDKAATNVGKHGVAFEDAATVFMDDSAKSYYDADHSDADEDRFYAIGFARSGRLLTVWYTERSDRLRLIGARRATPLEHKRYDADEKAQR